MKALIQEIRNSVFAIFIFALILCGVYPFLIWGSAQIFFPVKANGSLLLKDKTIAGSALLGQGFSSPEYFHSRPSAAGKGYDAASSSGTNLGPTSKKWLDSVAANVAHYRETNNLGPDVKIPADAVTASASGLDPHISPRNAELQSARIAALRKIPITVVEELIAIYTERPFLGVIGEPAVAILPLNLALDARAHP